MAELGVAESMIRPVCRRLPSSLNLWEDTNLPLSCVLTPLAKAPNNNINDPATTTTSRTSPPPPLVSVPKCLHCGAPQASTVAQYSLHRSLLCHLCGKTCSTRYSDQLLERGPTEPMDATLYNEKPLRSNTTTHRSNQQQQQSSRMQEFSLPVLPLSNQGYSQYQVPAMSCPPLWWIVVEGSPCRNQYWNTVTKALDQIITTHLLPYTHVGLAMASKTQLSLWNIQSAVPHVNHYQYNNNNDSTPNHQVADIQFGTIGTHGMNIKSALRVMADVMVCEEGRLSLTNLCQLFHDKITSEGIAVGSNTTTTNDERTPYAGARMLVILNGPPSEMGETTTTTNSTSKSAGTGGQGGSCFESGGRFSATSDEPPVLTGEDDEEDPERGNVRGTKDTTTTQITTDTTIQQIGELTPSSLGHLYPNAKANLEQKFAQLGHDFCKAAMGVDVLVVTDRPNQNFGLPLIAPLCERSGTPGPIIINLNDDTAETKLKDEIKSRTPDSFGGLLRVRLSPGFQVDASPLEKSRRERGPQLGPLYVKKGLYGPATATMDEALWQSGVCDASQTYTLDLQVTNKIQRTAYVNGLGEVALKPCYQVSYAYTTIILNENGQYVTVRRLRVATLETPIVNDTESLYASLDLEALAVVLFHKFATPALMDGLEEVQDIGRNWLKFTMVCALNSAELLNQRLKSHEAAGMTTESLGHEMFYPNDRLLNQKDGQFKNEEILLGQGHEFLAMLPLLVWSLVQSDCFRLESDTFRPTVDARFAALQQLASMSPTNLSRCIAPRLDLWQSDDDADEPIVTDMELSMESISLHLAEYQQTGIDDELILFLDSPFLILVCDCRHLVRSGHGSSSNSSMALKVGPTLQTAINEAQESYRTPPPIVYALDMSVNIGHLWTDVLIQDAGTMDENFASWKKRVAAAIHQEVLEGS